MWQYSHSIWHVHTVMSLSLMIVMLYRVTKRGWDPTTQLDRAHTGLKARFPASRVIPHADPRIHSYHRFSYQIPSFTGEGRIQHQPEQTANSKMRRLKIDGVFFQNRKWASDFWRSLTRPNPLRHLLQANPTENHSDFINETLKVSGKVYYEKEKNKELDNEGDVLTPRNTD